MTGEKEIADRGSSCTCRPLEATQLLDEAAGGPVSTRAITQRAGVRAPTLYHHFGSKQALLDAVVSHGFKEFLRSRGAGSENNDALEDVRAGWDSHVAFGLEFPGAYAHIYGTSSPASSAGSPRTCAHICWRRSSPPRVRGLLVSAAEAASRILAACSGVTLMLIQQPPSGADLGLSARMRESVLASISHAPTETSPLNAPAARKALEWGAATIDEAGNLLTVGERALMRELLARLGDDA